MKRKTTDGEERDVVSRWWRSHLLYMQRSGVVSRIKRRMRRRERHEAKREIREQRARGDFG